MTNRRSGLLVAWVLLLCVSPSVARAEAEAPARGAEVGDELTLAKGTWTAQAYGAFAGDVGGPNSESLISANVGVGYHIIDNLSLNAEAAGYGVIQTGEDTGAAELRLIMRHHLIVRDRWTIYADVGEGVFEAADQVPDGGTRLNFIFRAGVGGTYQLREGLYLMGGVRYFHLSNAQIEGSDRNPSINGVEGYVGLMFTWR